MLHIKESKNIRRPEKNNDNENSGGINTSVFIVVAVILLSLITGLVVIIIFQQRNKSLLNQVKYASFQQKAGTSNSNVDPDLLIQKSQQLEQ